MFWARPRSASGKVAAGADVIAVLPFEMSGPGLEGMGEGMVDLLSRNLDEVGAIRTVEPRTVLSNWRQRAGGAESDLAGGLAVGREVAAASILTGSVVVAGTEARLSGDLYTIDGARLAAVSVDGSSEDLLALVDSLSLALLREIWRSRAPLPRFDVAAITTGVPQAIRAYLEGARLYRASRWGAAKVAFERAVAADSLFASAHYMLARTLQWMTLEGRDDEVRGELDFAKRYSDRLPARERTLLYALEVGVTSRDEANDTLRDYLDRYPDDPEAAFILADNQFHIDESGGGITRFTRTVSERISGFDRVLDRDPSFVPALIHPLELSLASGDTVLIQRYMARLEIAAPNDSVALETYRAAAYAYHNPADVEALKHALSLVQRTDDANDLAWQARMALAAPLTRLAILRPAAQQRELIDWALSRLDGSGDARFQEFTLLLLNASGRVREAGELLHSYYEQVRPGRDPRTGYALMPIYLGYVDPSFYQRPEYDYVSEDAALRAQVLYAIDRGDRVAIRDAARSARDYSERSGAPFWSDVADAGEGFLRALNGEPEAGLAQVEAALGHFNRQSEPFWFRWLDWMSSYPETRADAVPMLQRSWPLDPVYEAPRQYLLGRAAAAEGDAESGRRAYQLFVDLVAGADSRFRVDARVDSARAAIDHLDKRSRP
jgi:TolB-like protein